MENRKFWNGIVLLLMGVLISVYGLINILYYSFTVIMASISSMIEGDKLGRTINDFLESSGIEDVNYLAVALIFVVGILMRNFGLAMLSGDSDNRKDRFSKYGFGFKLDNVEQLKKADTWKCPSCNTNNPQAAMKCITCGNSKKSQHQSESVDGWVCAKCGIRNPQYVGTCGCGEVKPK